MQAAHEASGAQVVTVAIRRIHLDDPSGKTMIDYLDRSEIHAACRIPRAATRQKKRCLTAKLAREALDTDLIKIEVIGDPETLYPDTRETIVAAEELVRLGFTVLPYIVDDPIACKQLEEVGCAAVMPLAAPIGSGLGRLQSVFDRDHQGARQGSGHRRCRRRHGHPTRRSRWNWASTRC